MEISHTGVVKAIKDNELCVDISRTSVACDSCRTRNLCHLSAERQPARISVSHPEKYQVGQNVTVVCDGNLGMKAVLLAFGLPLVLIVLTLAVSISVWSSEKAAVLLGTVVFLAYWMVMFLLRDRIGRIFSCRISECRQL